MKMSPGATGRWVLFNRWMVVLALVSGAPAVHADPSGDQSQKKLEAALAQGRDLSRRGDHAGAVAAFQRGLAENPNHGPTLSELSVSALAVKNLALAEESARTAINFVGPGAPTAGALYNLALVLEAKGDKPGAIKTLEASLTHRPHATVQRKLAALDPAEAARFAERVKLRQRFDTVARLIAASRDEKANVLREVDLDRDGKLERVAFMCADSDHSAILIEKDADHRWLLTFDNLIGRPAFGVGDCGTKFRSTWELLDEPYLIIRQAIREAPDDEWHIALRRGNPVVISHEVTNHRTDKTRTRNYDRPPYGSIENLVNVGTETAVVELRAKQWEQILTSCKKDCEIEEDLDLGELGSDAGVLQIQARSPGISVTFRAGKGAVVGVGNSPPAQPTNGRYVIKLPAGPAKITISAAGGK